MARTDELIATLINRYAEYSDQDPLRAVEVCASFGIDPAILESVESYKAAMHAPFPRLPR